MTTAECSRVPPGVRSFPSAVLRLLPFSTADGPLQMAADEVMLESAAAGVASLRIYRWDPPTLSLGYFQKHTDRLLDPRVAEMPWVRRASGGGAIIHRGDLTYALALPAECRQGRSPADWHRHLHQLLTRILREFGVLAEVVSGDRRPQHQLGFLCFAVTQPGDVVLEGSKIVGGAQRLRAGALLQHGSIHPPLPERCVAELRPRLAAALGWSSTSQEWTLAERERIEDLATGKYRMASWNEKR